MSLLRYLKYTFFLFFILVYVFSCTPVEKKENLREEQSGTQTVLKGENVFTGEIIEFPEHYKGKLVYASFFMTT